MKTSEPDRTPELDDVADRPSTDRSSEIDVSRDAGLASRSLGAAYLSAQVRQDVDALGALHDRHEPLALLAGLATACRSLVKHIADLERTTPTVVVDAYRDVWQQPS